MASVRLAEPLDQGCEAVRDRLIGEFAVHGPEFVADLRLDGSIESGIGPARPRPGRVVDAEGKPVAGREVRVVPTALDENRYYDPTVRTDKDGRFTIKHVRPGENYVQVAPFWLLAKQAPAASTKVIAIQAGDDLPGVDLVAQPER